MLFCVCDQSEPSRPTTQSCNRPSASEATVPPCTGDGVPSLCQGPQPEEAAVEGCFWVQSPPSRSIAHISRRPSAIFATATFCSGAGTSCFCQSDHPAAGSELVFHWPHNFPSPSTAQSDNWPPLKTPADIALKDDSFIGGAVETAATVTSGVVGAQGRSAVGATARPSGWRDRPSGWRRTVGAVGGDRRGHRAVGTAGGASGAVGVALKSFHVMSGPLARGASALAIAADGAEAWRAGPTTDRRVRPSRASSDPIRKR